MAIVARPSGWREMRRKLEIIQVVEENENNEVFSILLKKENISLKH